MTTHVQPRVALQRLAVLYATALLAGTIAGMLYHQVGRYADMAIVFPALAGALAGGAVALAAAAWRCPATRGVLLAGALAGGLAYAGSLYFDYRAFRDALATGGAAGVHLSTAQVDGLERQLLGDTGLMPYLSARARYGGAPGGGHGIEVQGDAMWVLWLAEVGVASGAGRLVVASVARRSAAAAEIHQAMAAYGRPA